MNDWYVVQTKPKKETVAVDNLVRQGYITYFPQIVQVKRRRQRWQKIIEPLFPRYLFVKLIVGQDNFAPIRSTLGVIGIVRFSGHPAKVPDNAIENIRSQEEQLREDYSDLPNWQSGDMIEITTGPFANMKGIYEKACGTERVMILLDMLGRQSRLEFDVNDIIPLEK